MVLLLSEEACTELVEEAAAVNWVRDAFGHLKVIGFNEGAKPLLDAASVVEDDGVCAIANKKAIGHYITAAKQGRRWEREPTLRSIG